jgi:hypothetical protein
MAATSEPSKPTDIVVEYKRGNFFTRMLQMCTENVLPQPETYLQMSSENTRDMLRGTKLAKRMEDSEWAYLERHKHMLRNSAQESIMKIVKAFWSFYTSLPPGVKMLFMCFCIFMVFVMFPAFLGAAITVMESLTELVRFVTIVGTIVVMGFVWYLVSI